jgi:hypothetical protein
VVPGASPLLVYVVVFALTVAIPIVHGPVADIARSILKPLSLPDLSCHVSLMALLAIAVAVRLTGEAGAAFLAAQELGAIKR